MQGLTSYPQVISGMTEREYNRPGRQTIEVRLQQELHDGQAKSKTEERLKKAQILF
jgi:hypothetical protein